MTNESVDYHVARLLILIDAFTVGGERLDGLTKLAKLDFLLRYPVFLERLLDRSRKAWPEGAGPTSAERRAVESRMIRYKYGPWDNRYYALVGALVGRGLVEASLVDGRLSLAMTDLGRGAARELAATEVWRAAHARSALLKRWFDVPGNQLKKLIYRELPEVVDRPYWAQI
jgi:hypothetical protein